MKKKSPPKNIYTRLSAKNYHFLSSWAWKQRVTRHKMSQLIHEYVIVQTECPRTIADMTFIEYARRRLNRKDFGRD